MKKDCTHLYCLAYFICFYLVYATAMILTMDRYRVKVREDITLRLRRGSRTARRTTNNRRYRFTN